MPIYEYYCKKCEDIFEELRSASDTSIVKCPECKKKAKRIMSACNGVVIGSEHRPLDCIIGADSEKKWEAVANRKKNRIAGLKANKGS